MNNDITLTAYNHKKDMCPTVTCIL